MKPERWHQLKPLLSAALDKAPAERAAFLDQTCGADTDLRTEVDHLLSAADHTPSILNASPEDLGRFVASVTAVAAQHSGQTIGPYMILHEIGHGGMGTVYLAEREDVGKRVALKLVRYVLTAPENIQRFLDERRILARLEHPNIARLLDAGMTEDNTPYLVMEYVEPGVPLTDYCTARQPDLRERLTLFAQAVEAVRYVHQNLVIHRDLKPSNILVAEDGDGLPQVKLLDFGIAKLIEEGAGALGLTRTGQRAMTPGYAAPEQVRGEAVTTATDVYSLGVILYELLVGERPYEVDDRTPAEIERLICDSQPARPSVALPRSKPASHDAEAASGTAAPVPSEQRRLQRRLRGDLDTICMKALAKEPGERYASAEALLTDVRRYLAGQPIAARPQTAAYRMKKFVQRHRWGVALAAVIALLVTSLAGFYTWSLARQRDRVTTALAESETVTSFLVDLFESNEPDAAQGEDVRASELLARCVERADALAGEPLLQARLLGTIGRVYIQLGRYEDAHPLLERALELRRAHSRPDDPVVGESSKDLGYLLQLMGQYDAAEPLFNQALEIFRRHDGEDHEHVAFLRDTLGSLFVQQGEYTKAEALYRQALEVTRRRLGDHSQVAINLSNLAYALQQQGKYDPAEELYREALAMHRRQSGDTNTHVALVLNNLSVLMQDRGDYEAAEPPLREALEIRRKLLEASHPSIATTLNNLGTLLSGLERPSEAEAMHREALDLRLARLGENHPLVALSRNNLGNVLTVLGRYREAEPLLSAALAFRQGHFGDDHPYTANVRTNLAKLHIDTGAYRQAETHLQATLAVYEDHYEPGHYRIRNAHEGLAKLYQVTGKSELAAKHLALAKKGVDPP